VAPGATQWRTHGHHPKNAKEEAMTASEVRSSNAREIARTKGVPFRPEAAIPVSHVDRAKEFGTGITAASAGSSQRHLSGPDRYAAYMVAEQAGEELLS
jgi:hypothetical protein